MLFSLCKCLHRVYCTYALTEACMYTPPCVFPFMGMSPPCVCPPSVSMSLRVYIPPFWYSIYLLCLSLRIYVSILCNMFLRICIFIPSVYSSVCMSPPVRLFPPYVCTFVWLFLQVYTSSLCMPLLCVYPLYILIPPCVCPFMCVCMYPLLV